MNAMMGRMASMKIRFVYEEEVLGMTSANKDIYMRFFADKAPDAPSREEEIAALGADAVMEKSATIFPRDEEDNPIFWDYQIKGSFKDACGGLGRAKGTLSSRLPAQNKVIDNLVFVSPRKVKIVTEEKKSLADSGRCQRPLFGMTKQGPRIALACSETVPAGSSIEFTVHWMELKDAKPPKIKTSTKEEEEEKGKQTKEEKKPPKKKVTMRDLICEWLDFNAMRGFAQWRNSGKGRYHWEILEEKEADKA